VLLEYFAVFLAPQLCVNRVHAGVVPAGQGLLHGAPVEVEHQQTRHVSHLAGQRDHVGIFQVEFAHFVAVT